MELTEFLLARLAEDENQTRAARMVMPTKEVVVIPERELFDFLTTWSPDRVLAECEGKRRIVAEHSPVDPCDAHDESFETVPCDTLRLLALPHADHADYDERWRP